MWPFNSSKKECQCAPDSSSIESSCKLISPDKLRSEMLKNRKLRYNDEIKRVKEKLRDHANYSSDTYLDLAIEIEFETEIINELAQCGFIVDISSRNPSIALYRKVYYKISF